MKTVHNTHMSQLNEYTYSQPFIVNCSDYTHTVFFDTYTLYFWKTVHNTHTRQFIEYTCTQCISLKTVLLFMNPLSDLIKQCPK